MLGAGVPRDRASLVPCLLEDQLAFFASLLLERRRRLLRGDERRPQEALELAIANEVGLDLFHLVGEVGALAPHVLEAQDDLVEELVYARSAVAAEERLGRFEMSDFDGSEGHGAPFQCNVSRTLSSTYRST